MTLLLNRELVSREKLCLVSGLPHIVKDYPKIRNFAKIFVRRFENVGPVCRPLPALSFPVIAATMEPMDILALHCLFSTTNHVRAFTNEK